MKKKHPISDIQKRIDQLEERKKNILRLTKERERKKRANRLIQTGALAEKYFELGSLSIEEREELFKIVSKAPRFNTSTDFNMDRQSDVEPSPSKNFMNCSPTF
ncbi:hypothetical protein ACQKLN_29360 [Paenibacillus glucanolyticus]|uniref:hypothetical protein n=1 Tax=Paenibacillus glucanolyticus TaxID=59843 RepID=UPI0036A955A7